MSMSKSKAENKSNDSVAWEGKLCLIVASYYIHLC